MSKIFTIDNTNLGILTVHYIDNDCNEEIFDYLNNQKVIGWDSETTWSEQYEGDYSAGVDPYRSRLRLSQIATQDKNIYLFDYFKISSQVKNKLVNLLERVSPIKI